MWMSAFTHTLPRPRDAASPRGGTARAEFERRRAHGGKRDTGVVVDVLVSAMEKLLA